MFHFNRLRAGTTEVFEVVIPQDSLPDAESRFGKPIAYGIGQRDPLFHLLGVVVLIHSDQEVECVVACKSEFRENELSMFYRQLEMLAGHHVYTIGGEPTIGWFDHVELKTS